LFRSDKNQKQVRDN